MSNSLAIARAMNLYLCYPGGMRCFHIVSCRNGVVNYQNRIRGEYRMNRDFPPDFDKKFKFRLTDAQLLELYRLALQIRIRELIRKPYEQGKSTILRCSVDYAHNYRHKNTLNRPCSRSDGRGYIILAKNY